MNRKILFASVVLAIGLLLAAAGAARADLMNGGFEDPSTTATSTTVPTDWTNYNAFGSYDWIANMTGTWAQDGKLGVAPSSPSSEVQAAFFQDTTTGRALYQVLSAVQANTTYTLTMDIGAERTAYPFLTPTVELGTGNTFGQNFLTLTGSSTPSPTPTTTAGSWKTWSYTFVTEATVPSANLRVDIGFSAGSNDSHVFAVDNVHLTAATPEPGTLALLVTGLLGLLAYAWRRRR